MCVVLCRLSVSLLPILLGLISQLPILPQLHNSLLNVIGQGEEQPLVHCNFATWWHIHIPIVWYLVFANKRYSVVIGGVIKPYQKCVLEGEHNGGEVVGEWFDVPCCSEGRSVKYKNKIGLGYYICCGTTNKHVNDNFYNLSFQNICSKMCMHINHTWFISIIEGKLFLTISNNNDTILIQY